MANSKPTIAARVKKRHRDWIEREAERRDRSKGYIIRELLEDAIGRIKQDDCGAVPA